MARAELGIALTALLYAAPANAQLGTDPPEGTRPVQWRVAFHEDPAHEAIVAWTTRDDGESSIYYDTQPHGGALAEYANVVTCSSGRYQLSLHRWHHCRLTGLSPSTSYYFVSKTANDVSTELYFVTAPDDGRPFRVLFGGDSRSDRDQRRVMNGVIRALFEQHPDIVALAHGGDYIQNGYSFGQFSEWMTDHELTITSDGRVLPVIASRGNHEGNSGLLDQVFATPGGEGNYYTTVLGSYYWLITLNTETSIAGDQRIFLENELSRAQAENACFISAQYHRPAFPAVKTPSDARNEWVPLFEQYDADLIFESDGHALKRTVPIRNEAEDPSGVVYVGEGGLGVAQRTPETDRWYISGPNAFAASQHHVMMLEVSRTALRYSAIAPDMTVVDSFELVSRRCFESIEVKSPMMGAELTAGSSFEITWITDGVIPFVDLEWSADDGSTWQEIATQLANTGSYEWEVPEQATTTARIRVRDPSGIPEGISGTFTIALPMKPEDPMDPMDPMNPEDPMDPMDPMQPMDPNDGVPEDPTMPMNQAPDGLDTLDPGAGAGGCACDAAAHGTGGLFAALLVSALLLVRRRR